MCLDALGVDFYVISAHKIHGPKGIGALVYKKGINIVPLLIGGGQENNLRSGTENVSGVMGLYVASQIAFNNLENNYKKVEALKNALIEKIKRVCDGVIINGENGNVSPYILSLSVAGIRGEVLLHMLEEFGIYISTGSACSSKHFDNRILESMGRNKSEVMGSVRISFNAYDDYDIDYISDKICKLIIELKRKIN